MIFEDLRYYPYYLKAFVSPANVLFYSKVLWQKAKNYENIDVG
jgi:hypothetical protein